MLLNMLHKSYSIIAYHLYAKPKITRIDHVSMFGFDMVIPLTVFHPKLYFSSSIIGKYLIHLDLGSMDVLDMGCGSGILGMIAASKGARVVSTDLNSGAVHATKRNAETNGLSKMVSTVHGYLFEAVPPDRLFDYILFNPPFYKKEPKNESDLAWGAGLQYETIKEFILNAPHFLKEDGKLLIIISSNMDIQQITEFFESHRLSHTIAFTQRKMFEHFYIIEGIVTP